MRCLDDIFQRPNIGIHLQIWNTPVKTFVVLVQQEKIDFGELHWIKMGITNRLQLTGIEIQSMFDIIYPTFISLFQTSKYVSYSVFFCSALKMTKCHPLGISET